ncbi:MAG: hypothetical protein WCF65_03120 [Parachlamydiaceae bacterium]
MLIKIAERLRPFSHQPGTPVVLPGSTLRLKVYPERVVVENIAGPVPVAVETLSFHVEGPLEQFTILQDLEKGCVVVWGHGPLGFVRYRLHASKNGTKVLCYREKGLAQETSVIAEEVFSMPEVETLSLGNHKGQDWALIRRRMNMEEILPLWHRLGQLVPSQQHNPQPDETSLFAKLRHTIGSSSPEQILPCFRDIFLAGFEGSLSPRLTDEDHQGICQGPIIAADSPVDLLVEGAALIRSLFVQHTGTTIALLPALPPSFHCGRLVNVACQAAGKLSIEWSKKDPRCVTFSATEDQVLTFRFSQEKTRCRLRTSHKDRGIEFLSNSHLQVIAGQHYWFDNFKK